MTEDRGQRTEDRGQMTEDRGQRTEGRGQRVAQATRLSQRAARPVLSRSTLETNFQPRTANCQLPALNFRARCARVTPAG